MSESLLNWDAYIQVASLSDIGMRRSSNQDNLSVTMASGLEQWQRRGHLFIVADGMGAHAAGELASKLAIDHIPHLYAKFDDISAPEALKKSVIGANTEIHRRGQANDDFHNMGTTCSVLTLLPQGAVAAHIGDSRVYRMRNTTIEQLTFDHSLVWEMKASGQLSDEEEKAGKIPKNVITRSLGPYPECKVDVEGPFPVEVGDTFLLCSDGLTGLLTDGEIGSILANLAPDEAVRVLVDLANLRGGNDNITCIVVKVTHPQLATSASVQPITLRGNSPAKLGINPISWVVVIAAGMATLLFGVMMSPFMALIPGMVFLGGLIWLLIQAVGGGDSRERVMGNRRFGKGPHTRTKFGSGEAFSNQLREIAEELRDAAKNQAWKIDWETLDKFHAQAVEAIEHHTPSEAIRFYSRSLSFLMEQLRNQNGSSSSLELDA
ncbi:MAG: protein phosphatase 2C domain-containing protein [Mariniblastus sp.]|nr:protein phosphatase 2C domain-containing protein [Mariniblastus sp.]